MPLKSYDEIARSDGAEQEIDVKCASSMKASAPVCFRNTGPNTSYITGTELSVDGGFARV